MCNRKPRTIGPETMAVVAMKKLESGKWSHVCKRSSSLLMIVDEVKGKSFYGTEDVGADKRHIYKVPKDELAAVLQVTEPSKNKDTSIRIYKLKDLRCYAQVLMAIKVPQACTAKACASRGSGMGSTSSGGETRNLGSGMYGCAMSSPIYACTFGISCNIEISESEWDSRVIQSELPVMVMFTADWCGTCRIMSPILDKLESDYTDRFTF
ncbi:hypothetical protein Bca52824_027410 [Brassica carinata]|uniref:Thioredoxin domain-containing protein n=1 Tax=Brassica carinata TaxID=52824 RepID=A0A8X7SK25_BRACI|nr:hypothetical protein Bca52824_027410 [Brassica carinata]